MTKKDYVAIARVIHDARAKFDFPDDARSYLRAGVTATAIVLCDIFAADNPRFDRERFLRACGIDAD